MATLMCMSLASCDFSKEYPKHIQEFPGPWQVLDPGKPLDKFPRIEVLSEGVGAGIEPGDLVQLDIRDWSPRQDGWREMGNWWIWIGFRSAKETAFFSVEPDVSRVLTGLREGATLRFLEGKQVVKATPKGKVVDRSGQLQLRPNPFGDPRYYSWRKNTQEFLALSEVSGSGYYSVLEVKRVCKGQARYRTVRLFDDGPVRVYRGWDSWTSHDPREMWVDEARIDAQCQDGRKAYFQFGPVPSPGRGGRSPVVGYFDDWFDDAWNKLPTGVQFEGNKPPILPSLAVSVNLTTNMNTPIRLNVVDRASDPDGDRLTMRSLGPPINGTLVANTDGSFTYTPKPGWSGSETLAFKASDGLVEADGVVRVSIRVKKPTP